VETVFGLADYQGDQGSAHQPQIGSFGAGAKDVKFWLADLSTAIADAKSSDKVKASKKSPGPPPPATVYISLFDYFRRSNARWTLWMYNANHLYRVVDYPAE
jgi:eukaryotic translation initiation factor 2C